MKPFLTLFFLLAFTFGYSQQDPQWSNYMYNQIGYNAGVAGAKYKLQSTASFRRQWVGFGDAPITAMLSTDAKIEKLHGGIGGLMMYNQLGNEKNLAAKLGYAYHLGVGPGTLQVGFNGEFQHKTLENQWISTHPNDPAIPTETSGSVFDAGFGTLFHTPKLQLGFGITHLFESAYQDLNIEGSRHYYLHGGYRYDFNDNFGLEPTFLVKSDRVSTQLDLTLRAHILDFLSLGFGYRKDDAYVLMLGYEGDNIRFGYAYDIITSDISNYAPNSHEFLVSFLIQ